MCKCYNCGNCTRDETKSNPTEHVNEDNAIEISCLKLPEELYDAICVLNGRYGTGTERKQILGAKYEKVQSVVNRICDLYD